jgi:hypothetical protein
MRTNIANYKPKHTKVSRLIKRFLDSKRGILLDISLGGTPQPRSVTLSPTGDLKHDPRELPFPLPAACVNTAIVTHVVEYLPPSQFFAWFDELWRVLQPQGVVYLSGPYGGDESHGWLSDPQHQTRVLEQSFAWLDPRMPMYALNPSLGRPLPKPWHSLALARVPGTHGTISYNVMLQKAAMNGNGTQ